MTRRDVVKAAKGLEQPRYATFKTVEDARIAWYAGPARIGGLPGCESREDSNHCRLTTHSA